MLITLPFPPASLSGHAKGHWRPKSGITASIRQHAYNATIDALAGSVPALPAAGDIEIRFTFIPPDRRGDRVNFPARLKAQIDGIADALEVNDSRFLPSYHFAAPQKPGCVLVRIGGEM